ncbi:hypothetical protein M3Y99_01294700 [Aphelenchoides fujianensis]|nr:hypothetical protein M3Y99_01294700 [Aphelenchoides fujianensis]
MPLYEFTLITRSLNRNDLFTTIKRAATVLLDHGAVIESFHNLGHRDLPFKRNTKITKEPVYATNYFLINSYLPVRTMNEVQKVLINDKDLLHSYAVHNDLPAVNPEECNLAEMLQPPAYRQSVEDLPQGPTMGQLFGKPKPKSRLTEQDRALMSLKIERDNLQKAYKRHEQGIERHKEMAKELLHKGHKDRALMLLKRKKFEETMMGRIEKHLQQIYTMIGDIETAVMNKELLETLQEGNKALMTLNSAFSLEDVEKIMEDTAEAAEYQQVGLLSFPFLSLLSDCRRSRASLSGQLTEAEQDDVEAEFDSLVHAELPEVPDHELEAIKTAARIPAKEKIPKEREAVALAAS